MRAAMRGRLGVLGLGIGALGGVLDTALFLRLGIDFQVAGRDLTGVVAAYLALSFAALGFGIGHLLDARARARRDAETIREQMRALDASRRAAAENEKLAAIGRLAAGVAHEVRNPLGVIRASASMVQEGFDAGDESHKACQFICDEIDRLNGLITSLLGFARPAAPRLARVAPEGVVERALALQAGELRRRGIAVRRSGDPHAGEISADPDLLAQVVVGLVTNACEAVGEGGSIALRLRGEPEAVRLEVADSGPGVAPEDARRIFEPFFTTKASGTGLGLAMTARIVEAHRGAIEVVPGRGAGEGGRGACFAVSLPREPRPIPAGGAP